MLVSVNRTVRPTQTRGPKDTLYIKQVTGPIHVSQQHLEELYCLTFLSPAN